MWGSLTTQPSSPSQYKFKWFLSDSSHWSHRSGADRIITVARIRKWGERKIWLQVFVFFPTVDNIKNNFKKLIPDLGLSNYDLLMSQWHGIRLRFSSWSSWVFSWLWTSLLAPFQVQRSTDFVLFCFMTGNHMWWTSLTWCPWSLQHARQNLDMPKIPNIGYAIEIRLTPKDFSLPEMEIERNLYLMMISVPSF